MSFIIQYRPSEEVIPYLKILSVSRPPYPSIVFLISPLEAAFLKGNADDTVFINKVWCDV